MGVDVNYEMFFQPQLSKISLLLKSWFSSRGRTQTVSRTWVVTPGKAEQLETIGDGYGTDDDWRVRLERAGGRSVVPMLHFKIGWLKSCHPVRRSCYLVAKAILTHPAPGSKTIPSHTDYVDQVMIFA
jgi:hypothetical protein